jgi:CubicO group peptidase (beta-lactamase class C family)
VVDWTEAPAGSVGMAAAGLDRAVDLVRARGAAAQLCVLRGGRVVLDRAVGCAPDSLFWIFSTSKPFVALLVHLLAERGALALDDRVADHWPEFGQRGKQAITVRQVLQHRSGVPVARDLVRDALAMTDWDRSVRAVAAARPAWPPGQVVAYQVVSFGFVLGELVRRVAGVPVPDLLAREFLDPLGLRDTHLGLPDHLWPRHVPVRGVGSARVAAMLVNRRATRRAVIPAAGVSTTARDLAVFYRALLRDGAATSDRVAEGDHAAAGPGVGRRILAAQTLAAARRPSTQDDEVDRTVRLPIRWAQGFQLGGPAPAGTTRPMGRRSSPLTFGHNGSNCCIAWADPTRDLVFVYLTNRLVPGHEGAHHQAAVADAVLAAC